MLPQLLNIIGGTKVRACTPSRRANGQARIPEPSTTPTLPSIRSPFSPTLKSLLASAEKMSAGARMFMLMRLTIDMSGFTRRA